MTDLQLKIESALSRSVCGGWDRTFLESILEQISKKRPLSVKQKQTLGKVLARNTPEDQAAHLNWASVYEAQYKKDAQVLGAYHLHQPYYKPLATDILAGHIPERGKFLRMYDNKYSKKVLQHAAASPAYALNDYLVPRAGFNSYKHAEFPSDMTWSQQNKIVQSFSRRGGFVVEICGNVRSCAKGSKRYKLLPIGEIIAIVVEERFLKRRKKKNKSSI